MLNLDRSTWKTSRFGDLVRNSNESVKNVADSGVQHLIALEHLDPGEITISRYGRVADGTTFTRRVRPGQTLFGKRRAYQRKAAYAEVDAICSGDILVFEAIPDRMSPRLLPFLVHSDAFFDHALGTSAGSLSPRTSWKALADFEVALPGLDVQERIADLLWAIEGHRQVLDRTVLEVLRRTQVVFRDHLFADLAEKHPMWALTRAAKIASGTAFPHRYQGHTTKPTPVVKVSDLGNTRTVESAANTIDAKDAQAIRAKVWPKGTVIFPKVGAALLTERRRILGVEAVFDNNIMGLVPSEPVEPLYLLSFMETVRLADFAQTGVIPSVNNQHIGRIQVPIPPKADQISFLEKSERVGECLTKSQAELAAVRDLTKTVLAELFGESS